MNKPTKKQIIWLIVLMVAIVVIIWKGFLTEPIPSDILSVELLNNDMMLASTVGVEDILLTQKTDNGTFFVCKSKDESIMIIYLWQDEEGNYDVKLRGSIHPDNMSSDAQHADVNPFPLNNITAYYNVFLNSTQTKEVSYNDKTITVETFEYQTENESYSIGFWCYDEVV